MKKKMSLLFLAGVSIGATGCFSTFSNNPALDVLEGMAAGGKGFVEAYIEYQGPDEKWVGPPTFLLHINAKEEMAVIKIAQPAFQGDEGILPKNSAIPLNVRRPASGQNVGQNVGMTGEVARNQLNLLASAIQSGDVSFQGCLSPLRVRMIRVDGGVIDKQGCRGNEGWPKVVGEAVSQFMAATVQGS